MRWLLVITWGAMALAADEKADVQRAMDGRAAHYGDVSRRIWEFAEPGYKEVKSAALLKAELRDAGFTVAENIAGIPTAFTATWGHGGPVIGIMGEYDALPALSQDAVPERKPLVSGGPGHGCGHNLLGTASVFAAVTIRDWLERRKLPGTIRFYGTPAEEGGNGKLYMIRAGVFKDADVVLTWHPGNRNAAALNSSLAIVTGRFRFYGKPAHAAIAPENGRSALDGLMIMTNAVEFLREHVPDFTRIHYVISDGGAAANVVPEFAELSLYARHPSMPVLDGIWQRILKCAEAGALASETRVESEVVTSDYNQLPNDALAALMDRNLRLVGGFGYTAEEQAFAEKLPGVAGANGTHQEIGRPLEEQGMASTDAGDVSWVVPTGSFETATFAPGIQPHTWQATACAGSGIGRRGMVLAAKTLVLTAMDLFTDPAQIVPAKLSFEKRRAGFEYRSRVPADQPPPLHYRDSTK
jgi:aminobenzoyl-glutamate utilization protein B